MIGNRQGRVLRALICLKNDILDVKAYNTQYRRAQKLPQPVSELSLFFHFQLRKLTKPEENHS